MFANDPEDWGLIPGRVILKTQKWYLIPPCLTLGIIRQVSRVKWNNPGKEVVPFSTPRCNRDPSSRPRLRLPTLLTSSSSSCRVASKQIITAADPLVAISHRLKEMLTYTKERHGRLLTSYRPYRNRISLQPCLYCSMVALPACYQNIGKITRWELHKDFV